MPLIEVTIYEDRLNETTQVELVARLTDAAVSVFGDGIREHTWVVLQGVSRERWGIAGKTRRVTAAAVGGGNTPGGERAGR
ncbi:4-oxalocrotonate tautomerase family protein [Streptomyces antimycoticus]|uniref:tautomerase family protein n=1 Tax=Streptomyces antimycoticus TaxID=68175 RepID=UPI00368315F0